MSLSEVLMSEIGKFYGCIIICLLKLHLIKNLTFLVFGSLERDRLQEKPTAFESEHPKSSAPKMRFYFIREMEGRPSYRRSL
jgi:hypothetical protein